MIRQWWDLAVVIDPSHPLKNEKSALFDRGHGPTPPAMFVIVNIN